MHVKQSPVTGIPKRLPGPREVVHIKQYKRREASVECQKQGRYCGATAAASNVAVPCRPAQQAKHARNVSGMHSRGTFQTLLAGTMGV